MPDVDEKVLLFNRVHKTGSDNFRFMMAHLAARTGRFKQVHADYTFPDVKAVSAALQVSNAL